MGRKVVHTTHSPCHSETEGLRQATEIFLRDTCGSVSLIMILRAYQKWRQAVDYGHTKASGSRHTRASRVVAPVCLQSYRVYGNLRVALANNVKHVQTQKRLCRSAPPSLLIVSTVRTVRTGQLARKPVATL